jgi:hypothetical protein
MKKWQLTVTLAPLVYWMDWYLAGAALALVTLMMSFGAGFWTIFMTLWIGNMVLSGAVILLNDWTGADVTLMEKFRTFSGKITDRSRIIGYLAEGLWLVKLIFWDGPDQALIFMRSRIPNRFGQGALFVTVAAVQMLIWTKIYVAGYDGVLELIAHFVR